MKTREEIEAMSDDERRISTAELCGWKQVEQSDGDYNYGPSPIYPWTNGKDWSDEMGTDLPDYLNSLDAMHETEKMIGAKARALFRSVLQVEICDHASGPEHHAIHATAQQRNTAFLMIMLPDQPIKKL